jgi:uncharacterized membrane protein YgcG
MNFDQFKGRSSYTAQSFALYLHDSWGVGNNNSKDNGIVLFISAEDGVFCISTGASLKVLINTDALIEVTKPHMKTKNYELAILCSLIQIERLLSQYAKQRNGEIDAQHIFEQRNSESAVYQAMDLSYLIAIFIICWIFCFTLDIQKRFFRVKDFHRGRAALHQLMASVTNSSAEESCNYYSSTCPKCLKQFQVPQSVATVTVDGAGLTSHENQAVCGLVPHSDPPPISTLLPVCYHLFFWGV